MSDKNISVPAVAAPITSKADLLLQLAERCEWEEPSRLLDVHIQCLIREGTLMPAHRLPADPTADFEPMESVWPKFTSSLDAAATLVPETCAWDAGCEIDFTPVARVYGHDISADVCASTPALALCAAALRARAQAAADEVEGQVRSEAKSHIPLQTGGKE